MHVDDEALRIVIRETLDAFLHKHEGLEAASVEVGQPTTEGGACDIIVDGCRFSLALQ